MISVPSSITSYLSFACSAPSLAVYGATAGLGALYFTSEWVGQEILKYVPGYNKKYEPKDNLFP